jgi:hypothetical protein
MEKDMFCAADYWNKAEGGFCKDPCRRENVDTPCDLVCKHYKHKWPTPMQFLAEYHVLNIPDDIGYWDLLEEGYQLIADKDMSAEGCYLVACTPLWKTPGELLAVESYAKRHRFWFILMKNLSITQRRLLSYSPSCRITSQEKAPAPYFRRAL